MSKFLLAVLLFTSVISCRSGVAQQAAPPLPVYDVVVIKLNKGLTRGTHTDMDDTTFQARNVSLKHLLVNTYGIREGQIFGLPGWADSARYDVSAKVTDPDLKVMRSLSREQRQAMLAAILVDRFHLQTHIEQKTLPVYELVVAKGGPKLTESAVQPSDANPNAPGNIDVHNTDMTATGVRLSELAGNLSFPLDRTVIDKTGLTGRYDFRLRWTEDNVANAAADGGAAFAPPNIFTAIQEQLGLKLQAAKGPVNTLVVDHVEQPTEN
jgi:uncharacterized protein (TIGR03435 family)